MKRSNSTVYAGNS